MELILVEIETKAVVHLCIDVISDEDCEQGLRNCIFRIEVRNKSILDIS